MFGIMGITSEIRGQDGLVSPDGEKVPLALLYEEACYVQEFEGDIEAAAALFKEVIDESGPDRLTQANSRFRLAECYQKMERGDRAQALLAELIAQYPEQQELVQLALDRLRLLRSRDEAGRDTESINASVWTGMNLDLKPVPWSERELLLYGLYSPTGEKIGLSFKYSRRDDASEEPAWKVDALTDIPILRHQQFTSYTASEANYQPLSAQMKTPGNILDATFQDGRVRLDTRRWTEVVERRTDELQINQQVFLLEQLYNLFRRIDLHTGYRTTLPVLFLQGGIASQTEVVVEGEERTIVPFGSFECYRVRCSFKTVGIPFADLTLWIDKKSPHYLVKTQSSEMISLLNQVIPERPKGEQRFVASRYHLGMKIPEDWYLYDYPFGEQSMVSFKLVDSSLSVEGIVVVSTISVDTLRKPTRETLEVLGLNDLANMKAYLPDLMEVPGSRRYGTFQDYPCMQYEVQYNNQSSFTEHRTFILRENTLVRLMLRSSSDHWDAQKDRLEHLDEWLLVNAKRLEEWK